MSLTVVFRQTALSNLARIRSEDQDLFGRTRRAVAFLADQPYPKNAVPWGATGMYRELLSICTAGNYHARWSRGCGCSGGTDAGAGGCPDGYRPRGFCLAGRGSAHGRAGGWCRSAWQAVGGGE
jgi:hypothetical protein